MIDTFYDIPIGSKFTPFVGLGLGLARNRLKVDTTLNGLAQSFGADASFDFGYRYRDAGDLRTNRGSGANAGRQFDGGSFRSHDFLTGLRYDI